MLSAYTHFLWSIWIGFYLWCWGFSRFCTFAFSCILIIARFFLTITFLSQIRTHVISLSSTRFRRNLLWQFSLCFGSDLSAELTTILITIRQLNEGHLIYTKFFSFIIACCHNLHRSQKYHSFFCSNEYNNIVRKHTIFSVQQW